MNACRFIPALAPLAVILMGCETPGHVQPDPVREEAFTREFETSPDEGFAAAAETMMDLGYVIVVSDRRAGLLCGQINQLALSYSGVTHLTLLVRQVAPGRTQVRSQPIMDQEFWTKFERRLHMADPVPVEEAPDSATKPASGEVPS